MNVTGREWMEGILIGILLVGGYFAILQAMGRRIRDRNRIPALALVLLFLFLCLAGVLYIVMQASGGVGQMLFVMMMLMAVCVMGRMVWYLLSHFDQIDKGMLALLITYVLALLYITIFSRAGEHQASVHLELFAGFSEAFRTHNMESIQHFFANIGMFVPFGVLFVLTLAKKRCSYHSAVLTGAMFSAFIETFQMIAQIGQCDVDDIVANTLGTLIGYLIGVLFFRR